jgi:hypothetical protein
MSHFLPPLRTKKRRVCEKEFVKRVCEKRA